MQSSTYLKKIKTCCSWPCFMQWKQLSWALFYFLCFEFSLGCGFIGEVGTVWAEADHCKSWTRSSQQCLSCVIRPHGNTCVDLILQPWMIIWPLLRATEKWTIFSLVGSRYKIIQESIWCQKIQNIWNIYTCYYLNVLFI